SRGQGGLRRSRDTVPCVLRTNDDPGAEPSHRGSRAGAEVAGHRREARVGDRGTGQHRKSGRRAQRHRRLTARAPVSHGISRRAAGAAARATLPGAAQVTGAAAGATLPGAAQVTGAAAGATPPGAAQVTGAAAGAAPPGAAQVTGAAAGAAPPGAAQVTGAAARATPPGTTQAAPAGATTATQAARAA